MRNVSSFVIAFLLCSAAMAAAPPQPPSGPPKTDLAVAKIAGQHLPGDSTATFTLAVTNYGPSATGTGVVGATTVTDQVPAPATFNTPVLPPFWSCTPPSGQSISCTYDKTIFPGETILLSLSISVPPGFTGPLTNCASVVGGVFIGETNPSNNSDCTCVDFKSCASVSIDISTGTINSVPIASGQPESGWQLVSAPAAASAAAVPISIVRAGAWIPATNLNAAWISFTGSDLQAFGDYVYELPFNIGPQWKSCTIDFSYAVDNEVQIGLVGGPMLAQTPGFGAFGSGSSSFTSLHGPFTATFTPQAGLNILRARVQNGTPSVPNGFNGPSGLLVVGSIDCTCGH
jgi:uncharacterized protein DUF11